MYGHAVFKPKSTKFQPRTVLENEGLVLREGKPGAELPKVHYPKPLRAAATISPPKIFNYLTVQDYFATGEGRLVEVTICSCSSEAEAVEHHLKAFDHTLKHDADFYKRGLEVCFLDSPMAKELLETWFKDASLITDHWIHGGQDFKFRFKFNRS